MNIEAEKVKNNIETKANNDASNLLSANELLLICQGLLIGLVTGLIVSLFRLIIDQTLQMLAFLYPLMAHHWLLLIPYVAATLVIALLLGQVIKGYTGDLLGSCAPKIAAIMHGHHSMNAWQVLWRKFVGALLAICPGLFLGREDPCIQMGACVGQGFSQLCHGSVEDQRLLLGCGAAAGLSAAFSAPLTGVIFLLEDITHNFKLRYSMVALAAACASDLVTIFFFGTRPCLYLPLPTNLPTTTYIWLIPLGMIIGLLALAYHYCMHLMHRFYRQLPHLPWLYSSLIPLLLVIPIGLWNPRILGGSHLFIADVTGFTPTADWANLVRMLVIFTLLRFFFSIISYSAAVPGGIFMPALTLGALIGALLAVLLIHGHLLPAECYLNMVVITMAAYFGAAEEIPFTAITLLCEMVGTVDQAFPIAILTLVAYVTRNFVGDLPRR